MARTFELWSNKEDWRQRRGVYLIAKEGDRSFIANPLVFEPEEGRLIDPLLGEGSDGTALLQAFLDHAWSLGMRPAGFSDVPLQVEAIKYHLEDMRRMVFGAKPIDMSDAIAEAARIKAG